MEFSFRKMGAAIANFFTGNPELESHQKQFVDAMAEDVQDVNTQMSVLLGQIDVLTGEKSALQADLDSQAAQVASLKADADKYAEIKSSLVLASELFKDFSIFSEISSFKSLNIESLEFSDSSFCSRINLL
jgi:hypothetical protein